MTNAELRALDAECARWMGCEIFYTEGHEWGAQARCGCVGSPHGRRSDGFVLPYTTDIKDAWTLVEKLVADGHQVRINANIVGEWAVRVEPSSFWEFADTAPLAIVRMALAVKGGG